MMIKFALLSQPVGQPWLQCTVVRYLPMTSWLVRFSNRLGPDYNTWIVHLTFAYCLSPISTIQTIASGNIINQKVRRLEEEGYLGEVVT